MDSQRKENTNVQLYWLLMTCVFFCKFLLTNYSFCTVQLKHRYTRGRGGGEEEGGTSCTPSKDFEKFDHKITIKQKNRGPPPRFSHNPKYPPQKNLHRETERGLLRRFFLDQKYLKNVKVRTFDLNKKL